MQVWCGIGRNRSDRSNRTTDYDVGWRRRRWSWWKSFVSLIICRNPRSISIISNHLTELKTKLEEPTMRQSKYPLIKLKLLLIQIEMKTTMSWLDQGRVFFDRFEENPGPTGRFPYPDEESPSRTVVCTEDHKHLLVIIDLERTKIQFDKIGFIDSNFYIYSCTAQNNDNSMSLDLVQYGCLTSDALAVEGIDEISSLNLEMSSWTSTISNRNFWIDIHQIRNQTKTQSIKKKT